MATSQLIRTLLLAFSLLDLAVFADESIQIEIKSSWTGLGAPAQGHIVINGRNGRYRTVRYKVDGTAVAELLAALESPVVEQPSLESCGITETWLAENYARGLVDYTHRRIGGLSAKQVELFRSHFVAPPSAGAAFSGLFERWHTDDFPEMSVVVRRGDREYGVQSISQYPFMLPWVGTDRPRGGYSCRISRAIAALVRRDFPNRSRLVLGTGFRWDLTSQVMGAIEHDWDLLDTENRVGPEVAPVFARFVPLKSAISNLSSIDLDGDQSWNAELRSSELPLNFVIGVSLRYHNRGLSGIDTLLTQVPEYSQLVLSVPWIRKYLEDHPDTTLKLRYVNGRSLSPKALERLAEDLGQHGKAQLAETVSQQAAEAAFLEIDAGRGCWSRAIMLPSRDLLLWHFHCDSVLGFPAKDFDTWDYYGWRSTATIVTPDGKIRR